MGKNVVLMNKKILRGNFHGLFNKGSAKGVLIEYKINKDEAKLLKCDIPRPNADTCDIEIYNNKLICGNCYD